LALAVPLSRFTPRVGGGSAFFVRHHSRFMKTLPIFLLLALLGCSRSEPRPDKNLQILQWVPFGTSLESARRSMEQHQFSCSVVSCDSLEQLTNKIPGCGYKSYFSSGITTNVSIIQCKSAQGVVTFILVNNEMKLMEVSTNKP